MFRGPPKTWAKQAIFSSAVYSLYRRFWLPTPLFGYILTFALEEDFLVRMGEEGDGEGREGEQEEEEKWSTRPINRRHKCT